MSGPHSIKCQCGSTNVIQENDVGFDINDEGEERQHLQRCKDCGAVRFVSDFIKFDGESSKFHGKWHKEPTTIENMF